MCDALIFYDLFNRLFALFYLFHSLSFLIPWSQVKHSVGKMDKGYFLFDNLVITPHTGDIVGSKRMVADLFVENLGRWQRGEPLLGEVDPERGY